MPVRFRVQPVPFEEPGPPAALAPGATIAQMIEAAAARGELARAASPYLVATIAGHEVPAPLWRHVRAKAGTELVVSVRPQGGPGGSNPLKTILQIALYIGSAVLAVYSPVLAALALTLGNALIAKLFPVKGPEQVRPKPRYEISGGSNAARPHQPVPILLGRRRIFPPRAANWYRIIKNGGKDIYLRMLFEPCLGRCDHSDPRLGPTPIESYQGVTLRWRTRPDEEATTPLWFLKTPAETPLNLELKESVGWNTRALPIRATSIEVDLAFLSGLFATSKSTGSPTKSRTVSIEVRYGPRGGPAASATPMPHGASGVVSFTRADPDPYIQTFAWDVTEGDYDVHCRRVTADADDDDTRTTDNSFWFALRAFSADVPMDFTDSAWIEMEIKASDQLNGIVDDFSFVATSMVPTATSTGPGAVIATRNPADLLLAATYPPFSDLEIDTEERRYTEIATWRALCETRGWACDLIEDGEVSVGELLQRVATCGRALADLDNGVLTVAVDDLKPAAKQLLTARNVSRLRGELAFLDDIHALNCRYANAANDYLDDVLVVYAPGQSRATASRFEAIEFRELTDEAAVKAFAQRLIAERIARPELFRFEQDVEHIILRRGDRALLNHPAALIGQTGGRVMERVSRLRPDGALQQGVRLDERVTMVHGTDYALVWRTGDVTDTAEVETVAGDGPLVWWPVGAVPASPPAVGALCAFGAANLETLDVIITGFRPMPGLKAEVTAIPYAPELLDLDGLPVVYASKASVLPQLGPAPIAQRGAIEAELTLNRLQRLGAAALALGDAAVSDLILTPSEKRLEVPKIQALIDAEPALSARAAALGLGASAEAAAYTAALAALVAELALLTDPVPWNDFTADTEVDDPVGFEAARKSLIDAEAALRTRLAGVGDPAGAVGMTIPIGAGASTAVFRSLGPSGTGAVFARIAFSATAGPSATTARIAIEVRPSGGGWAELAFYSEPVDIPGGAAIEVAATVANSAGVPRIFEVRANVTFTGGPTIAVTAAESYLTV